ARETLDLGERGVRCRPRFRRRAARSRAALASLSAGGYGRSPASQRGGLPHDGRRDRPGVVSSIEARMLTVVLIVAQQLTFTPYHANGMYELRERVGWNVGLAPGETAAGTYTYTDRKSVV